MRTLAFILRYILPFFEGKGEKSACSVTDTISRPVKVRSFHFPGFSHLVALHSQQPAAIAAAKSLQSCPTLRPHRRQPTRLLCPWDSPGKNAGVGCHFLLQYMKVESESEVAQSCLTLRPHRLQPTRLLRPWDFPGKSTGVGCHCLLSQTELR